VPAGSPVALRHRLERPGAQPDFAPLSTWLRTNMRRRCPPSRHLFEGDRACPPAGEHLAGLIRPRGIPRPPPLRRRQTAVRRQLKGHGSLSCRGPAAKGKNRTTTSVPCPSSDLRTPPSSPATRGGQTPQSPRLQPRRSGETTGPPSSGGGAGRHGEPSVFKHVILHHQENRTTTRSRDMREGTATPLVMFGEEVSPTTRPARQFTLFR